MSHTVALVNTQIGVYLYGLHNKSIHILQKFTSVTVWHTYQTSSVVECGRDKKKKKKKRGGGGVE